jgi:hypothetical protein
MELTVEQYDAINETLIEHNYISSKELSESERHDLAVYWIGEAEKAWIQSPSVAKNDEAIRTILNISPNGIPKVILDTSRPKPEFVSDKLPIPKDPDFEYTHLPTDFTTLTDIEIRRYSSHNQHFLNRARYLLAQVINHQASALHLRDDVYRKAYIKYNDELEAAGERATKDLINSYATQDEEWKRYDADARKAQADITSLKALVEVYSGNVERLSREWTMRQNEWEKGR